MSLSNAAETNLLELLFNNTDWTNIGDASGITGSAADGHFYLSFHTSDPGETGSQTTNECSYGGYARGSMPRDNTTFTVSGNSVTLASGIATPEASSGSETITHFAIGRAENGAGEIIVYGTVSPNISVSTGVTPSLTTSTSITAD